MNKKKQTKNKDEKTSADVFVNIFTALNTGDLALIKSILDDAKIPYYIKGENWGALYAAGSVMAAADVMVRKDCAEDAQELLKDIISPGTAKEGGQG